MPNPSRSFLACVALTLLVGCQEYGLNQHVDPATPTTTTSPEPEPPPVKGEPVADAGHDAEVQPLDTVALDGSKSYDPDGYEIVAMEWTVVSRPDGSTADLSDRASVKPQFFADLAGDYVFELTVQNEKGVWDSTPDQVVITALPLDGFYVQLAWDAGNDLDLHLLHGNSALFSQGDCNYCNQRPSWNASGQADDPSLDWDVISGFGPETITIDDPSSDTYRVGVHYYGENGLDRCVGACAAATATVSVYISGSLAATFHQNFANQGELWEAAEIEWPSGVVTEIDDEGTTNLVNCQ